MFHKRPLGQPTRGKTALNRLRRIDVYVILAMPWLLSDGSPLVVDLGYGAYPWTTLEMRERWLPHNPRLRVLGIEIDPFRVEGALPFANPPQVDFRLGGFNLADVLTGQTARIVRCFNVLRQYEESEVSPALAAIAPGLEYGGVLIEGTSNPSGRLAVFDLYVREAQALRHRAIVFAAKLRHTPESSAPFDPADFQAILPKRLIHRMREDGLERLFKAWQEAYWLGRGLGLHGTRQWIAAAKLLRSTFGYARYTSSTATPGLR